MSFLKKGVGVGCKYLTDADLGNNTGSQTHIGLLEGVFDESYNENPCFDVPVFVCDAVGSGTICLDFIQNSDGTLRSPKIRMGKNSEEKKANVTRTIRAFSELFPNRKWFLFFSIYQDDKPFFVFLLEGTSAWDQALSCGLDFNTLDKTVIYPDSSSYICAEEFISNIFNGTISHEKHAPGPIAKKDSFLSNKSLNRIVFGAPGTGKSFILNEDAKAFIDDVKILNETDLIQEEVSLSGNSASKNYAIGMKYHKFFKGKKPKAIAGQFMCSEEAAYCVAQGAKAYEVLQLLPEYDEESFNDSCVKKEYTKLWEANKSVGRQACAALVGYRYSEFLEGKTGLEFDGILNVPQTSSLGYWVLYGVQSASYEFEHNKDNPVKRFERVTFHPDYSYSQFVGTYKPVKSQENGNPISYEYVPGPFIRVLVKAIKNPQKPFLLLIEEINRANVAAVFGDVFQLLDRGSDGFSLYPVEANEDLKNYLSSVGIEATTISIPSNMYIWATMNSADQGVFPMDTAFKRRWEFEYIGINSNEEDMKDSTVILGSGKFARKIRWNDLRKAINDYLAEIGINEDKQLGPYFIGRKIVVPERGSVIDPKVFNEVFKNKVIMYLFDDAAKQRRESVFAGIEGVKNRYSAICEAFDIRGIAIFNESIRGKVELLEDRDVESASENA